LRLAALPVWSSPRASLHQSSASISHAFLSWTSHLRNSPCTTPPTTWCTAPPIAPIGQRISTSQPVPGAGVSSEAQQSFVLEVHTLTVRSLLGAKRTSEGGQDRPVRSRMTRMYGPAAFRKRDCAWVAEVADMYPACLIGSRAVALMGIRVGLISGQVGEQPFGSPDF
jgi:hypothetical protein